MFVVEKQIAMKVEVESDEELFLISGKKQVIWPAARKVRQRRATACNKIKTLKLCCKSVTLTRETC